MDAWKFLLVILACVHSVHSASKEQWRSRSIYQIVTDRFARSDNSTTAPCDPKKGQYCGGTFRGIIDRLDYIQDLGFSAIWISPVTYPIQQNTTDLSAYHGYWPQDLYSINPKFGTPDDLKALAEALHSRQMYLMVDVVVNNLAWAGSGTSVNYSWFNPFNNQRYFHPYKLLSNDPLNETCVEECWLGDTVVSLPDLRTEDDDVSSALYSWVDGLVSNYSIDGLRLDSVFNAAPQFWSGFNGASKVFCLGEARSDNVTSVCPLQNSVDGLLNYPIYERLTEAFNGTSSNFSSLLEEVDNVRNKCEDIFSLGTFTENQDVPRFASYTKDISLARNIITYNLLGDGIPILYYGQEQHYSGAYNPANREALWLSGYSDNNTSLPSLVQSLNRLRSYAAGNGTNFTNTSAQGSNYLTYLSLPIHNDSHILALRKGFAGNQVVSVLSNLGSHPNNSAAAQVTLKSDGTGFSPGQNVTEVLSCKTVVTDASGNLNVVLNDGGPRVYYPTSSLNVSGICGHEFHELVVKSLASSFRKEFGIIWLIALAFVVPLMMDYFV